MTRLLPVAVLACVAGCSESHLPLPPLVDAFRSSLADPERFPIRDGDDIRIERLGTAMMDFARKNREALDAHFQKDLSRVPAGTLPKPPDHSRIREVPPEYLNEAAQAGAIPWALYPSAERITLMACSMFLPVMLQTSNLERQRIGAWLSFFSTAKPALTKVVHSDDRVSLISDYGGVDLLVVTLARGKDGWSPAEFSWWRPRDQ